MRITTQCPHCGKTFGIDDTHIGRKAKCAGCNGVFEITPFDDSPRETTPPIDNPERQSAPEGLPASSPGPFGERVAIPRVLVFCLLSFLGGTGFGIGGTVLYRRQSTSEPVVAAKPAIPPEPKVEKPPVKLPELFRTQLLNYVKAAGKLDSLTTQGVNIAEFGAQLASVRAELDLLVETWPADIDRSAIKHFNDSIVSYNLTYRLWKDKNADYDPPTEPSINGWQDYVEFAGGSLVVDVRPEDYLVPHYRGKRFLPPDRNISVLMRIGAERFKRGREAILPLIQ